MIYPCSSFTTLHHYFLKPGLYGVLHNYLHIMFYFINSIPRDLGRGNRQHTDIASIGVVVAFFYPIYEHSIFYPLLLFTFSSAPIIKQSTAHTQYILLFPSATTSHYSRMANCGRQNSLLLSHTRSTSTHASPARSSFGSDDPIPLHLRCPSYPSFTAMSQTGTRTHASACLSCQSFPLVY